MQQKETSKLFLAFLSGLVFSFGFAPFKFWFLIIGSIGVLFYLICTCNQNWGSFRIGFCFGIGQFGAGISWVYVSMVNHGNTSEILALILTTGFVSGLSLFPANICLLFNNYTFLCKTSIEKAFFFCSLWITGDALRSWLFTGFPWLLTGTGSIESPLAGFLPIIGSFGVGYQFSLVGAMTVVFFKSRSFSPLFLITLFFVIGYLIKDIEYTTPFEQPLKLGLWQPAIVQKTKWSPDSLDGIIENHFKRGLPTEVDIIVWPETALPMTDTYAKNYLSHLNAILKNNNQTLFTGILGDLNGNFSNRILAFGSGSGTYDKKRLVPFGEFVPFESKIRGLISFFNLPMSKIIKGPMSEELIHENIEFAPLICYEIAFSGLARKNLKKSHAIITISNDTWFGGSIGPAQHLEIAQIRARELGRPIIRVTNDGITATIDKFGRISDSIPPFAPGLLITQIQPETGTTPYTKWGEGPLLIWIIVSVLILRVRKSYRNRF